MQEITLAGLQAPGLGQGLGLPSLFLLASGRKSHHFLPRWGDTGLEPVGTCPQSCLPAALSS